MPWNVLRNQTIRFAQFVWQLTKREPVIVMAVVGLVLGIWIFAEVSDEVLEDETQQFDEAVIRWLRDPQDFTQMRGPHWTAKVARDLTALGSTAVVTLLVLFVFGYLLLERRYGPAGLVAASCIGAGILSWALKGIFQRPRPDVVPHLDVVSNYSFPSGHAMTAAVVYLTLGALLVRIGRRRRVKFYFLAAAMITTVIIGVSRVYVGVHYPTDVIAGWSAGMVWASLVWLLAAYLQWHYRRKAGIEDMGLDGPAES